MSSEQAETDAAEWENEGNWYVGHSIYWSRRDSRIVVPKWHDPKSSATLNLGRPMGAIIVVLLVLPMVVLGIVLARG